MAEEFIGNVNPSDASNREPSREGIPFLWETRAWNDAGNGVREKIIEREGIHCRLVDYPPGYHGEDWCVRGHTGCVVQGTLTIEYRDRAVALPRRRSFRIPAGESHGHRARNDSAEPCLVFLIDDPIPDDPVAPHAS